MYSFFVASSNQNIGRDMSAPFAERVKHDLILAARIPPSAFRSPRHLQSKVCNFSYFSDVFFFAPQQHLLLILNCGGYFVINSFKPKNRLILNADRVPPFALLCLLHHHLRAAVQCGYCCKSSSKSLSPLPAKSKLYFCNRSIISLAYLLKNGCPYCLQPSGTGFAAG